jgi:hypothetical protein
LRAVIGQGIDTSRFGAWHARCLTVVAYAFFRSTVMPERKTVSRAQADERAGKAPSTQAGEFVKEEIDHVRAGKHGVSSAKQAVAIGLSKARRAGVDVKPPKKGTTSEATRQKAEKDIAAGQGKAAKKAGRTRAARAHH